MAIAVAQTVFADDGFAGASGTTIAVTLTVGAGSVLLVCATWDASSATTTSCSDSRNGSYGTALGPGQLIDSVNLQGAVLFQFTNTAAGSTTVTVTFGTARDFKAISVVEITGAKTASAFDVAAGQIQATPGTGTDAVTSGNASAANQPCLAVGFSANNTGIPAPTAGTGYTSQGTGWTAAQPQLRVESERFTTTGNHAATFTAAGAGSDGHATFIAIFDEAAAPPTLSWAPTLSWTAAPPGPPVQQGGIGLVTLPPVPTVPPLAWMSGGGASVQPLPPTIAPAFVEPLVPIVTTTVPALSWQMRGVAPALVPPTGDCARSIIPILPPTTATTPPLSWAPTLDHSLQLPPSQIGSRQISAYEASPGAQDLSWQPELSAPTPPPPPAMHDTAVGPISPIPNAALPPLSWAPVSAGMPLPPQPLSSSRVVAPVAPLVAPPLSWLGWQPPPPVLPPPQVGGGSVLSPLPIVGLPPLAWLFVPTLVAAPPPWPTGGGTGAPIDPLATPVLAWRFIQPWSAPPAPPLVRGGSVFPVAPLAPPALAWMGVSAGAGMAAPVGMPSSEIGPMPAALPVPSLSWVPHVTAPLAPVPPPAFDAQARSMLPIASQVLVPLSWAPEYTAPIPPAPGVPQSLIFGPIPPLVSPVLVWTPSWRPPAAPGPGPTAPATFAPVLPPAAAPALSWAPSRTPEAAFPGPAQRSVQVVPVPPPALLPLSWLARAAAAAVADLVSRGSAGFAPVLVPALPTATWLLPSTAQPTGITILTRSSMFEPVTVPAPNVPPPLQPQGYVSAPLAAFWNYPQLQIVGTITAPPAPPPLPSFPVPPPFVVQLQDDGSAVNLTGLTVICRTVPADRTRSARSEFATVIDALLGVVEKTWTEQDLRGVQTGDMLVQFVTIDLAGRPRTYPGGGRYYHVPITGRPR